MFKLFVSTYRHELVDPCRLAETVAQSCCMALAPYLDQLAESELTKIGLRVTLDSERDRVCIFLFLLIIVKCGCALKLACCLFL